MTPERWERIKQVFGQALDVPPALRPDRLLDACDGDDDLRREAEALLKAHDSDPGFMEGSVDLDPADIVAAIGIGGGTPLPPGTVLGDSQYRIIGEAGRGGMAIVYLAEDLRLPRRVALKSLPGIGTSDPSRLERFRREAWAAAKIAHPAVATIYAFEQFGGDPFIVYELVRGRTLGAEIRQGPIAPRLATRVAIDIARALDAAHQQGVVHRDLKPDNVMLTADDGVKVLDFGIAQLERTSVPALTQEGTWLGTPAYMAPEQREGRAVDARADIYSFGVMLSEMLTGRHPLAPPSTGDQGPASHVGDSRRSIAPAPARAPLAGPFDPIVQRCLQLDPAARYPSARALLTELEGLRLPDQVEEPSSGSATWWWEFHQVAAAVVYGLMVIVAWEARDDVQAAFGGRPGGSRAASAFFVGVLASVVVSATLRLNLWFTARQLPRQLRRVRRRIRPWILAGDWGLVVALVSGGLRIMENSPNRAFLLLAVAIGAAVAASLIEPVTTRAAFEPAAHAED